MNGADVLEDALYYHLFDEAEQVRWRVADLPWQRLDGARVPPALVRLVREIAYSELTTFSATRRFMQEFTDDVDFTQWLAVWFYEETKHPQVLMRWLAHFGERFDAPSLLRARATAPFMKSRMSTLVMNVISEMVASARYLGLSRSCREPVLAEIARNLGADEARHATTFYAYARRLLARSAEPDVERLAAVKSLYFWCCESDHVQHPVNLLYERAAADPELAEVLAEMPTDLARVQQRICALVGALVGRRIDGAEDVRATLRELAAQARRPTAATEET